MTDKEEEEENEQGGRKNPAERGRGEELGVCVCFVCALTGVGGEEGTQAMDDPSSDRDRTSCHGNPGS